MRALLVNPWVYDFKAFDFWNKPLGLLIVASILKKLNIQVSLLDCMDRCSPCYKVKTKTGQFGRGKYPFKTAEKPGIYKEVPRFYKRYGMPRDIFSDIVRNMESPDIIFITSGMTYWYPGVFEVIRILRESFPKTKIILGGIYANLCAQHAQQHSGADIIFRGPAEENLSKLLTELGYTQKAQIEQEHPAPDFSLYEKLHYGVVLTSRGCPFDCTYCATKILYPQFQQYPNRNIIDQLSYFDGRTENIAFFDDALLYNKDFPQLLQEMIEAEFALNYHASNGLHCRSLNQNIAGQMYRANFKTMYLSLETTNPVVQKQTGGKVNTTEFIEAVGILKKAGFPSDAIHTYILYGMPGQDHQEIVESIKLCHDLRIHPHLCEFSPIPHTDEFERTGFNENTDPLYHNNLFYTWYYPTRKTGLYNEIKKLLTTGNI
jgi:radical SAM superfamily enzyme YgiQ (UPF0313 family)